MYRVLFAAGAEVYVQEIHVHVRVMTDRGEEWWDGESGRRARKALLLPCWVFNELEQLPGLFLPAVAPTKPRYLALAVFVLRGLPYLQMAE